MSKLELLTKISLSTDFPKEKIDAVLKQFQAEILEELRKNGEVSLLEIGKIKIFRRSERKGMNLFTKAPMVIPASNAPKFVFSKKLKEVAKESVVFGEKVEETKAKKKKK